METNKWREYQRAYDWWWKLPLSEKKRLNRKVLGEKDRLSQEDFIKLYQNK